MTLFEKGNNSCSNRPLQARRAISAHLGTLKEAVRTSAGKLAPRDLNDLITKEKAELIENTLCQARASNSSTRCFIISVCLTELEISEDDLGKFRDQLNVFLWL